MLTLDWPSRRAYEARLFDSHDFSVDVDILDLNERVIGSATFIDGQVNILPGGSGVLVRREADLTLSDPAGALDFSKSSAWSGTSMWVDRLVRIQHTIHVGDEEVTATVFVGPPASMSRSGAEVSVHCQDKTALAIRGCPPITLHKGENAVNAIKRLLQDRTGEFRFRFPTSKRRLSKDYAAGWNDEASPWIVARRIARVELGWQLTYAADGYALLRPLPRSPSITVPGVTEPAVSSVDFTKFNNHVRVLGKATTKKVGKKTIKTQPFATATIKGNSSLSPSGLKRKGVLRYMPLVLSDDAYTKTSQVRDRAITELEKSDRLETSTEFSCVPFFHADVDDIVRVQIPGKDAKVRLASASIPLGVSGDMTIGSSRPVSKQPAHKSRVETLRWKKVTTGRKGHRKSTFVRI